MECPICNGKGTIKENVSKEYDHAGPQEETCDICCGNGYIAESSQEQSNQ